MPTIRLLLLITGNLRIFSASICRTAFARSSSSRQQWMPAVITSRAVARRASKLSVANPLQTMSRSVTMPISWSFAPIGIAPISCSRINFAISVTGVSAAPLPESEPEAETEDGRSARQKLLDALIDTAESGPQTRRQLIDATALDGNTLDQALLRAKRRGEIESPERGVYLFVKVKPKPPPAPKLIPASAVHLPPGTGMAKFIASAPDGSPLPKPAAPPKPAVPEADVELFRSLLVAVNGRVNTNHPPGGGVTDLRIVKAMLRSGASLEHDILPTLRAHVGEPAQRPIASWSEPWFVDEVAESHRRRLAAAQKPAAPAAPGIDDEELLDALMDAAGGNYYTNTSILDDPFAG
jgi:hypothetical protein